MRRKRRHTRIILADGQALLRDSLRVLLHAEADMRVVGEAGDGVSLARLLGQQPVDLLLLDPRLPGPEVVDRLRTLHREHPAVRILVLGSESEDRLAVQCVQAGASGFVGRNDNARRLLEAIRKVMAGGIALSPALTRELAFSLLLTEEVPEPHARLSPREELVFRRLVGGASVSGIAAELGLSVKTVSTYKSRLQAKLDCEGLAGLMHYAAHHRLYRDPPPDKGRQSLTGGGEEGAPQPD